MANFGDLRWREGAAVVVVLAAENYPGRPRLGDVVIGAEAEAYCTPGRPGATTARSCPPVSSALGGGTGPT
ncbi:phosphoribosylamine-glycine ligase domain protein [Mycobacterium xenopi 4042]|uniref:Phosphoribosylamine-glycine ligase domain protein n=1 Tax=Mycobacterium xenopi 4042 TaxID=1299334 RepID=X8CUZ7_MYCXE|nr:phosphoribosylamine-glycine ligase domain protein [Mycobacterium xenopi 4042]